MAYTDGETAILNRIKAHADYNTANTDQNDWKKLNRGNKAYYAIVRPNQEPAELEFISLAGYVIRWVTVVEVWQRYKDDGSTQASLFGNVQKIITQLQPYKKLGLSNVHNSTISSVTPPQQAWRENEAGPSWLTQELSVIWEEFFEVTFA